MAAYKTASQTIAEMREFASFTAQEQFFIERSLEILRDSQRSGQAPAQATDVLPSCRRVQTSGYRELAALRGTFAKDQPVQALDGFFAALVRVSALDLARGAITSFAAYRFLYERMLGAAARPYLPSSFCAAAALPQIDPTRRKQLLESLAERYVTTPGWSEREPLFFPQRLIDEPEVEQ